MMPQCLIDDSAKELGLQVARARKEKGLTQEQLAAKAGISSHTLLDLEAGRGGGISFRNLVQVLAAVGVSVPIGKPEEPIDYVGLYLSPWNNSERNRTPLRVGDTLERARRRLAKKRELLYG